MRALRIIPCIMMLMLGMMIGCYETQVTDLDIVSTEYPGFESPVRIKAGGEFVAVEDPGYASPTMADVDGDGRPDLVVGQYNEGHMQFFKNISEDSNSPQFASSQWIKTGDKRAVVPGVW